MGKGPAVAIGVLVGLIVGFFSGREYLKHELKTTVQQVLTGTALGSLGTGGSRQQNNERSTICIIKKVVDAQVSRNPPAANISELNLEGIEPASLKLAQPKCQLEKSGYCVAIVPSPDGFSVVAYPIVYDRTGNLTLYSDKSGVIKGGDIGDPDEIDNVLEKLKARSDLKEIAPSGC